MVEHSPNVVATKEKAITPPPLTQNCSGGNSVIATLLTYRYSGPTFIHTQAYRYAGPILINTESL